MPRAQHGSPLRESGKLIDPLGRVMHRAVVPPTPPPMGAQVYHESGMLIERKRNITAGAAHIYTHTMPTRLSP